MTAVGIKHKRTTMLFRLKRKSVELETDEPILAAALAPDSRERLQTVPPDRPCVDIAVSIAHPLLLRYSADEHLW
jgi:hypothetical protein